MQRVDFPLAPHNVTVCSSGRCVPNVLSGVHRGRSSRGGAFAFANCSVQNGCRYVKPYPGTPGVSAGELGQRGVGFVQGRTHDQSLVERCTRIFFRSHK